MEGIQRALKREFGEDCRCYKEQAGLEPVKPYFLIQPAARSVVPRIMGRSYHTRTFSVQYHPGDSAPPGFCAAAERMEKALETVGTEAGSFRGSKMRSETADGILRFFVDYSGFTVTEEEKERMGGLTVEPKTKG